MSDYPKWVQRAHDIGAVLCLNKQEEQELLADWEAEQPLPVAEKSSAEPTSSKKKPTAPVAE